MPVLGTLRGLHRSSTFSTPQVESAQTDQFESQPRGASFRLSRYRRQSMAQVSARDLNQLTLEELKSMQASLAGRSDPLAKQSILAVQGAILANQPDDAGKTPLILAIARNCPNDVRALLLQGANPNQRSQGAGPRYIETCPIVQAAASLHADTFIEWLLSHGANVNSLDATGANALFYAADRRDEYAVERLIEAKANVFQAALDGDTALHRAARTGGADRVIDLLIDAGADVNAKNHAGVTPLAAAIAEERRRTTALLLQKGGKL